MRKMNEGAQRTKRGQNVAYYADGIIMVLVAKDC